MYNFVRSGCALRGFVLAWLAFLPLSAMAQNAAIESKADETLRAMSDYLAGLESFSFSTDEKHDRGFLAGERKTVKKKQNITIRRPNKLVWSVTGNKRHAFGVYDGENLSYSIREKKAYAQVSAPDTLDDTLDFVSAGLRLPMPVADILYTSPYDSYVLPDTRGEYIGEEKVHGVSCHHLSFSHPALEWEMWIQTGDKPLLRKLSLFYTQVEEVPESTIYLNNWNASPEIKADTFNFTAPEGFQHVKVRLYLPQVAVEDSPEAPAAIVDAQK